MTINNESNLLLSTKSYPGADCDAEWQAKAQQAALQMPAQSVPPSQFGSPELQSMIVTRAVEKQAQPVLTDVQINEISYGIGGQKEGQHIRFARAIIAAAIAQTDSDAQDAERYRWLRSTGRVGEWQTVKWHGNLGRYAPLYETDLDAAIDAAMKGSA